MNIIERINALEACKSTAEVVALLEENEAKGLRSNAASCPVACYLSRAPDAQSATADSGFLYWSPTLKAQRQAGQPRAWRQRRATEPVSEFVSLFDRGIYPQLIAS